MVHHKLFQINTLCLFACSQNFHSILKWDTELNLHCLLIYAICHVKFNFNGNTVNSTQHFLSPFSRQTFIQQGTTFHNCCPHPWLSQKTKFYLLSQSHLRPYSFNSVNSRSPPPPPLTILTHENKRHQLNVSAKVPSEVHISEWCKIWQYILLCGLCVYLPVYQAKSAELKSSNDRLWETQKQNQKMDTNTCTHTKIVLYQIILV